MSAGGDDGSRVSPTAHYTADVWVRSGLSDPALSTRLGAPLCAFWIFLPRRATAPDRITRSPVRAHQPSPRMRS